MAGAPYGVLALSFDLRMPIVLLSDCRTGKLCPTPVRHNEREMMRLGLVRRAAGRDDAQLPRLLKREK